MAVSNYTPNKCKYRIDELDNVVYIVNKEGIGGIKVDDGEAYIDGVGYYNAIDCLSVSLSESESLDERYEFLHTVNFSVTGYLHWYELNDYYVMLKDKSNTYWLVNPYFKIKYTYTYTLDATSNHTDYVVSTKSNYPLLRVKNFNADNVKPCKTYDYCGVDVMAINETTYSKYVESFDAEIEQYVGRVKYTNDGFKIVNYKKNTCVFTETFDGNNISHSVKFQVNFDDYKASWDYNLLEFTDNKYAVILSTKCGKKVATGFGYGLQPSYTVTADDNQAINNIEIQLSDLHDNGNLLKMPDELPFEHDSATTWSNVEGEYTCIDPTTGVYTLRQEYDIFGNALNNYMCLQGFEDRYASYHIVGTFTDEESFYCPQCRAEECTLNTSFPSNLSFYTTGCKTFSIRSSSDFTIESNTPYITVSPSAGTANQSYSVTVCNSQTPTSTEYIYSLTVTYCSGQTKDYSVTVTEAPVIDCLPNGDEYNVSVYAQDVTIPTNCCIQSVSASCCVSNIQIQDGYVKFRIDANNSGAERTVALTFTKCDGTTVTATITQAHYYSRWVYEGSQCNGEEWCALDRMYSGETPDNINTPTYITRYRDCRASSACATPIYKWENMDATTDFYCNDCPIQYKWENMNPSTDFYCNNCEIVPQYRWINLDPAVDYYCSGTTKYYKQQQQISTDGGNVWENVSPPQYRIGESAQTQSSDCGYIPTIEYRWIDLDPTVDYYCSGTTKYYKEKKQYSLDSGVTWIDVTPAEYQWGASAETESEDCGYIPAMYEWRRITPISGDSSTFICEGCEVPQYRTLSTATTCVGVDKYTLEEYQVSYDGGVTWQTTGTSATTLIEAYSEDCGYVPMQRTTSGTPYCSGETGYDKYVDVYSQVSYDSGSTWVTTATTPTLVEADSEDCGYTPTEYRLVVLKYDGTQNSQVCSSDDVLNYWDTRPSYSQGSDWVNATVGGCVAKIGLINGGGTYSSVFKGFTSLTSVTIDEGVDTIGDSAFASCTSLSSITLPNSVTILGNGAFGSCTSFKTVGDSSSNASVKLPNSLRTIGNGAFAGCTSLTSVNIPNGVTMLGGTANYVLAHATGVFNGCTNLTSVGLADSNATIKVPNTLTTIGQGAFEASQNITSVTLPNSVTSIGVWAFSGCSNLPTITIPNSVTYIDREAFSDCTSLTSITLSSNITAINNSTFSGCTNLRTISIPNMVTYIDERAFYSSGLHSIAIPNNVTSMGINTFASCTALTSVTIGNGLTAIPNRAFYECKALSSINIGSGVTSIGDSAFSICTSLTSVTIPSSVTSIGYGAFYRCSGLSSINIGSGVTSIGTNAFSYCRGLTSVTIPDSVTTIGEWAFSDCSSLTSVTIGSGITYIDNDAFVYCSGLQSITCLATTPPQIDYNVFSNTNNCPIYVPCASVSAYKSTRGWSDYASRIQAIP